MSEIFHSTNNMFANYTLVKNVRWRKIESNFNVSCSYKTHCLSSEQLSIDGQFLLRQETNNVYYPERVLVGVDTHSTERWSNYHSVTSKIKQWAEVLPREIAEKILMQNGLVTLSLNKQSIAVH